MGRRRASERVATSMRYMTRFCGESRGKVPRLRIDNDPPRTPSSTPSQSMKMTFEVERTARASLRDLTVPQNIMRGSGVSRTFPGGVDIVSKNSVNSGYEPMWGWRFRSKFVDATYKDRGILIPIDECRPACRASAFAYNLQSDSLEALSR